MSIFDKCLIHSHLRRIKVDSEAVQSHQPRGFRENLVRLTFKAEFEF
jgi:hypothetical protein